MFGRAVLLALTLFASVSMMTQETARPIVVHEAPISNKFPAAWYPPETQEITAGTDAPVIGKPYIAENFIRMKFGERVVESVGRQMRDSEGRLRSERPMGDRRASNRVDVTVDDPGSHCHFTWAEHGEDSMPHEFAVQCSSRKMLYRHGGGMLDRFRRQSLKTSLRPEDIVEELGERVIEGQRCAGFKTRAGETWIATDLDEIMLVKLPDQELGLKNVVPREPDPALFYPPEGYRINSR